MKPVSFLNTEPFTVEKPRIGKYVEKVASYRVVELI